MYLKCTALAALLLVTLCAAAVARSIKSGKKGDILEGGPTADKIVGKGSDDRVFGGNGADKISVGPGHDLGRAPQDCEQITRTP